MVAFPRRGPSVKDSTCSTDYFAAVGSSARGTLVEPRDGTSPVWHSAWGAAQADEILVVMLAQAPSGSVVVPKRVQLLADGELVKCVWENTLGGLTFEVGEGERRRFIKWSPAAGGIDLGSEAERLSWAVEFTPVPRVIDLGRESDGSWLITAPLPGESAVSERWKRSPERAVVLLGKALRSFHDALPIDRCPFTWSIPERVADARGRVSLGSLTPTTWEPVHCDLTVDEALIMLDDAPPIDRLVVCQGDACTPNTIIAPDGEWSGHVDLGEMGVADRWADLAIATWSTEWNYGPGLEDQLLAAYGVAPDLARTVYYRLLWELGP